MIALLALCPIRLKNFVALDLQASFRRIGSRWWIVLDRKHTKSGRPDERRVPRDLDAAIGASSFNPPSCVEGGYFYESGSGERNV